MIWYILLAMIAFAAIVIILFIFDREHNESDMGGN